MATILDQRSQAPLTMAYDPMRYQTTPQFTDPWTSSRSTGNSLYQTVPQQALPQTLPAAVVPQQHSPSRNNSLSSAYSSGAYSNGSDALQQAKSMYYNGYQSTAPQAYPQTQRYSADTYQAPTYAYDQMRRGSYPNIKPPMTSRDSFNDALDASQGMVAMSQDMTTPRAPYGRTGSIDSYGFPQHHSTQSSISSSTGYPQYYHGSYSGSIDGSVAGSVAGSSVTDYSSEAENLMASRAMPSMNHSGYHQDQAAMMTQFNSKMSASAQKKHKCKICDKRFTRPSSLQTHMYSHTGEKPFACDFEGCGRHFSVVSNLRRHKKCHKSGNDHPSPDVDRNSDS